MTDTVADLTEADLIARIRARLQPAPPWLLVGIGDDAAVVEPERNRVEVLSVDALVEGVHFDRRFTPPAAIGHRALAVNLSDLAAMGAAPRLALLSLALPPQLPVTDFDGMIDGLAQLARRHGVHLVGGNLTRSPGPLVLDVTVVGTVKRRQAMQRVGARAGDEIYVTGSIGAAAAGLQALQRPERAGAWPTAARNALVDRYLYPQPRIRIGLLLSRNRSAAACVDLSDGLADGVRQIARASGVGAVIDAASLPIDPEARRWFEEGGDDPIATAVTAGDDYELLLACRPRLRGRLRTAARHADAPLTRIGVVTEGDEVVISTPEAGGGASRQAMPRGFTHFK